MCASDKLEVVIPLHTLQYSAVLHLFSIAFLESLAMSTLTRALTLLWLGVDIIVFHPGEKGFKQQLCFATKVENVVVTNVTFKEIKHLHSSAPLEW